MKLGIALSGGGIRGIAHAGVLQALEDNNIKPDIIGGTSCGSMIAVMYALGYTPYHIYLLFKRYASEIAKINTIPVLSGIQSCILRKRTVIRGFNNGEKIEELYNKIAIRRNMGNINQIKMPIVIPTVDLVSGREFIITNYIPNLNIEEIDKFNEDKHITKNDKIEKCNIRNLKINSSKKKYLNDISVGKAVRASSSFPGFYAPCNFNECIFMDGGALNNVPVDEVKLQGADCVIAVKFHSDEIEKNSNIMDVIMKSIDIMGSKISEESLKLSNYILDVYTDKVGLLDVEKLDKCYEYGYNAVIENLQKIKDIISKTDI